MLIVRDITKKYDEHTGIESISFQIHENEVVGVLGENGAGKTTLINSISSIMKPNRGEILFDNYEYGSRKYKQRIGVTLGGEISLFERLTVKENLNYYSSLYGERITNQRLEDLEHILKFDEYSNMRIETLSRGMKQRVSIAASLVNDPELILFDEPTIGLDISGQIMLKELVQSLKKKGKMILYSTNIIQEVKEVCDKVLILHKGYVIEFDSIENIENKYGSSVENIFVKLIGE